MAGKRINAFLDSVNAKKIIPFGVSKLQKGFFFIKTAQKVMYDVNNVMHDVLERLEIKSLFFFKQYSQG
jgi:hypothetical protein